MDQADNDRAYASLKIAVSGFPLIKVYHH
jgi:hypothetical protein